MSTQKKIIDLPIETVTNLKIEAAKLQVKSVKEHMQNILIAHAAGKTEVVPEKADNVVVEEVEQKAPQKDNISVGSSKESF